MFNTINSIFFLIHKNADQASNALAKFSDLLRYQLYECNDVQIPLGKELSYMENFIELEKLRQNDNVVITTETNNYHDKNLSIAPFILMIFVENAFKHVSKNADGPNWIHIKMELNDTELGFFVTNSVSSLPSSELLQYGGIGLKNVQRRLDLIYPEKFELNIKKNEISFEVKLRLSLSELMVPQFPQVAV